jgi:hypothetical protein
MPVAAAPENKEESSMSKSLHHEIPMLSPMLSPVHVLSFKETDTLQHHETHVQDSHIMQGAQRSYVMDHAVLLHCFRV